MKRSRVRFRWFVLWTLVLLVITAGLIIQALMSLHEADQACFFGYPAVPCPGPDDAAVVRIRLACVGIPLVWGSGIALIAWAAPRFDRGKHPSP